MTAISSVLMVPDTLFRYVDIQCVSPLTPFIPLFTSPATTFRTDPIVRTIALVSPFYGMYS